MKKSLFLYLLCGCCFKLVCRVDPVCLLVLFVHWRLVCLCCVCIIPLIFPPLLLSVLPFLSWQHYYPLALIVLCDDGNECASLKLCRFSHSLCRCCFLSLRFVLQPICRLKKTKRSLFGAHNQYIVMVMIDRLAEKEREGDNES